MMSPLSLACPFNSVLPSASPATTVALLCGISNGRDGAWGKGLGIRYVWKVGDEAIGGNGGTAGISSANEGVDLELVGECLGTGADDFLIKAGGMAGFSPLPSDSDWGCDGELDLCEMESAVEAGEGGARDSGRFPGAVLGRLLIGGTFNGVAVPSFSLFLVVFRLYHLSFPIPLLFGDVGSAEVFTGIAGLTSDLLCNWGDEALAGDGVLPEADEFVETETASSRGFLSLPWPLILTEGTCRNEWNNPPCDLWGGCWGIGGGGGKSWGGRLGFE